MTSRGEDSKDPGQGGSNAYPQHIAGSLAVFVSGTDHPTGRTTPSDGSDQVPEKPDSSAAPEDRRGAEE